VKLPAFSRWAEYGTRWRRRERCCVADIPERRSGFEVVYEHDSVLCSSLIPRAEYKLKRLAIDNEHGVNRRFGRKA
jgi:hypothetical protein